MATAALTASANSVTSSAQTAATSKPLQDSGLDAQAFLTLFLAQLEHQDPLNPQDTTELNAQLATFSQLEQSIASTATLKDISEKLDQLIQLQGGSAPTVLDPVSLIGKTVDVADSDISIPYTGSSEPLSFSLTDSNTRYLLIEGVDESDRTIGISVLAEQDEAGDFATLAPGTYELYGSAGDFFVRTPAGEEVALDFLPYSVGADGNPLVGVQDSGAPSPVTPSRGERYTFSLRANTSVAGSSPALRSVATSLSGTVDGVRLANGQPVLSIGGQDVDPSTIVRIR